MQKYTRYVFETASEVVNAIEGKLDNGPGDGYELYLSLIENEEPKFLKKSSSINEDKNEYVIADGICVKDIIREYFIRAKIPVNFITEED